MSENLIVELEKHVMLFPNLPLLLACCNRSFTAIAFVRQAGTQAGTEAGRQASFAVKRIPFRP